MNSIRPSIPRALPWADLLRPLRGEFSGPFRFQTPLSGRRRLEFVRIGSSLARPTLRAFVGFAPLNGFDNDVVSRLAGLNLVEPLR